MTDLAAWRALAEKYAALVALRRDRAAGLPIPEKEAFSALARRFPGALWELDRLPIALLEHRARALDDAARGGPVAPWMRGLHEYHALYRAALFIKAHLRRTRAPSAEAARALADAATARSGTAVSVAFVAQVADPPAGRIEAIVMAETAARVAIEAAALRAELFPGRPQRAPMRPDVE